MHLERAADPLDALSFACPGWPPPADAGFHPGRSWYSPCRAVAEFAIALVLLVLTAPAVLFSAVLVRMTSRGPAVYQQARLGRGGRVYTMYKLRSMYHECERLSGPCWSSK